MVEMKEIFEKRYNKKIDKKLSEKIQKKYQFNKIIVSILLSRISGDEIDLYLDNSIKNIIQSNLFDDMQKAAAIP